MMKTIAAGEFKAKCLALMDEVHTGGQSILITKRGKAVARLAPVSDAIGHDSQNSSIFGFMNERGVAIGKIVGPILPEKEWDLLNDIHEPASEL